LLAVAAASVLLGTMYPLVIDALDLGKLSVGPPYFNTVFVAVMTPAMFLLGIGPIARWKKASIPELAHRLRWALGASLIAAIVIPFYVQWKPLVSLGVLLAIWIAATGMLSLSDRLKGTGSHALVLRLMSLPRAYWGMQVAHLGVAVLIVGVAVVTGYESEKNLRMEPGDSVSLGDYDFQFNGLNLVAGPNYEAVRADMNVFHKGVLKVRMHPEKRVYNVSGNALTNAAIDTSVFRDLYVAMGEPAGEHNGWSFRIQYKPFVVWIWAGAFLMAVGGVLALTDRRYVTSAAKKVLVSEAA
jgi:cytochrome c-type biogenesis protein CcmF